MLQLHVHVHVHALGMPVLPACYMSASQWTSMYMSCITITSLQFSVEVQHFEMFLSGHMYALTNQPPREDVLQLALLVPGTSEVNRQAKGIVHNERKRSWFDWT